MDIEDFIDIARRHKAWILGPTFAALVISVVVAFLWPDTFLSTAIIRVVPPQVPETYVPPNTTTDMQGRINGLTQTILNRSALTSLVNKHQLYKKELSKLPMDDVIESMKAHDIKIGQVQTFAQSSNGRQAVPAFMIGFQYSNRWIAQKVTNDLVASFLSESLDEATQQTMGTTDLLQIQWENAKNKLSECDQRLQAFRIKNMGRLPDEQQGNYSQLNSMQTQLISLDSQMSRITGEKLQLDNELRITKQQVASLKDPNADQQVIDQKNEKLAQKDKEIEAAENYLARLRERYKDSYPDVQTTVQQLALLRRQRDDIRKEDAGKKTDVRVLPPNPMFLKEKAALQANEQRITTAEEQKDLEMKELQRQSALITESLKSYQARIEATPLGEKEYSELISDRDLALKAYQDADEKLTMSKKAQDVTRRQQGEKLEILDPPNLPGTPTEPKRPIIVGVGTGLGLFLGLLLAGAREMKDTSLKNLKDVRAYTHLQVLGSIPLLENDLVVRRRRRLGWLAWSTAFLVGIIIMSSSVVYYFSTKM
jgi:uncharacterized protein involved in exopolysaccharide biosynthesis